MTTITRFRNHPVTEMLNWLENEPVIGSRGFSLAPVVHLEDFVEDGVYTIRAEIPGIDPDKDVQITLDDDVLTIQGERREEHQGRNHQEFHYGSFSRWTRLPAGAKGEELTASYEDGVLVLRVPLAEDPAQPRVIPVQRGSE